MIKLDVCIVTHGADGLEKVAAMDLPKVDGVRYVVSWQTPGGAKVPEALMRPDIKMCTTHSEGSSANRNNAFDHSSAPLILVADNDVTYTSESLLSVIRAFDTHPEVDVATFQYSGTGKSYPAEEQAITRRVPKGLTFSAIEIALRRRALEKVRFDTRYGVKGSEYPLGEDEKFMLDAVRAGLNCRYFPIVIASHPHLSTGSRPIADPRAAAGTGALIRGWYPWSWPLRIPLKAWRLRKSGSNFWMCLRYMLLGALK